MSPPPQSGKNVPVFGFMIEPEITQDILKDIPLEDSTMLPLAKSPGEEYQVRILEKQQEMSANLLRFWEILYGQLTSEVRSQIQQLRVEQLEELGEALLDFSSMQDLVDWLRTH